MNPEPNPEIQLSPAQNPDTLHGFWYPPDTQRLAYRWFDPWSSAGIGQGPAVDVRLYKTPELPPGQLLWELDRAFDHLKKLIKEEYSQRGDEKR